MENKEYMKKCPKCGGVMFYATQKILQCSIKHEKSCRSCSMIKYYSNPVGREKTSLSIKNAYMENEKLKKKISISSIKWFSNPKNRQKMSQTLKKIWKNPILRKKASDDSINFYLNPEERTKMRNAVKVALHRPDIRKKHIEGLLNSKWIKVKTDNGQLELIEKWNNLGFNFESNYQIHTDRDLFYVDGYDKEKNVVLEYDSKYHNKLGQKNKDLIRQRKIINILKPNKFWRYNSVNKEFRNVLEN